MSRSLGVHQEVNWCAEQSSLIAPVAVRPRADQNSIEYSSEEELETQIVRNQLQCDSITLIRRVFEKSKSIRDDFARTKIFEVCSSGNLEQIEYILSMLEMLEEEIIIQSGSHEAKRNLAKYFAKEPSERIRKKKIRRLVRQSIALINMHLRVIGEGAHRISTPFQIELRKSQLEMWSRSMMKNADYDAAQEHFDMSDYVKNAPKRLFAENYTLIDGMEKVASENGYDWVFISPTCPPSMHVKQSSEKGKCGVVTPTQAMKWLRYNFSNARKRWENNGIKAAGLWTSEAQGDATPHLHILLFAPKPDLDQIVSEFRKVPEWSSDVGCTVIWNDQTFAKENGPARGSTIIATYLLKNLNTKQKLEGECAANDEWRSTWQIRSIGFMGLPGKGTWRAFRSCKTRPKDNLLRALWDAAQSGSGYSFIRLQGGLNVSRKNRLADGKIERTEFGKVISLTNRISGEVHLQAQARWDFRNGLPTKIKEMEVNQNYPRKESQTENPNSPTNAASLRVAFANAWHGCMSLPMVPSQRVQADVQSVSHHIRAPPPAKCGLWISIRANNER
jgi:hypothetical protein